MTVALDTNILLDVLLPDPNHLESSLSLLTAFGKKHLMIISEVVYGELATQFADQELLWEFLSGSDIRLVHTGPEALWIASRAWQAYTKNRLPELQCPACGQMRLIKCQECGTSITARQHLIPDFLIGGHALSYAGTILTRDRGFYSRYFPDLVLGH